MNMELLKATQQDLSNIPSHKIYFTEITPKGQVFIEGVDDPEQVIDKAYAEVKKWLKEKMPLTLRYAEKPRSEPKRIYTLIDMILLAHQSLMSGEIEKARFNEVKEGWNRVVDAAFREQNAELDDKKFPHDRSLWRSYEKFGSFLLYSVHDAKNKYKLLSKYKDKRDKLTTYDKWQFDDRYALLSEFFILSEALDKLKEITVPTKRRVADPKADENKGEQKICGYCFRPIRLMPKNQEAIAYHGFVRDDGGYGMMISGSCDGAGMKPLELSHEATYKLLNDLSREYKLHKDSIPQLENRIAEIQAETDAENDRKKYEVKSKVENSLLYSKRVVDHYVPRGQRIAYEMLIKHQPYAVEGAKTIIRESGVEHDFLK